MIAAAVLLVMNATLGFFLTQESSRAMKSLIANRMLDISNTAAAMLDGDVLAAVRAEDVDTPEYRRILETLTYYQDNIDLRYIYCIRDTGGGNFIFTIDPTTDDPGEFGEPIVYTEALYKASLGEAAVDDTPYEDKWGRFYSAYTPVFDSKGNVAGIVAVDFDANWYDRQISNQIRTILIITALSLSFGIVIVFMIVNRSAKRIRELYNELNNLSDGIEELAGELSEGTVLEGAELLHAEDRVGKDAVDEVSVIGNKIRSLQKYMKVQVEFVREKAYRDGLTGLENRTAYLEYAGKIDDRIKESETIDFTVAMFDINGLKDTNDNKGHESGDELIRSAAAVLVKSFEKERVFRIGGDEFVVIIENGGVDEHFAGYESNVSAIKGQDSHYRIMSNGYTVFDPSVDSCFEDTFKRADRLMYENKKEYYEKYGNRRR